jgi:hypothetical protein
LVVTSASTADSRGVTVSYQVNTRAKPVQPLTFGVYRSADGLLGVDDPLLGTETVTAGTLDDAGKPADAPGTHSLTVPLPGGLAPNPRHPFVIAAANPADAIATGDPRLSKSFRTFSLAVVVHGGIQNPHWASVPLWEGQMVAALRGQGYDQVIPFDWVKVSNQPGYAAPQSPRLVRQVLGAVQDLPANEPVDLQLIGHSEGAVIVSQALIRFGPQLTAALHGGYVQATLLDPHSANADLTGRQYSVTQGPLGWYAKGRIDRYQSEAKDPLVVVPPWVNRSEVFYQHTVASRGDSNGHIYNLWGQVPVRGQAVYYDLTGGDITHAGKTGVPIWYTNNVVPTLGNGEPGVVASALSGALVASESGSLVRTHQPEFAGRAAPGSIVRLFAAPAGDPSDLSEVGQTVTGKDGAWSLTTRPIKNGSYRVLARALPAAGSGVTPRSAVPTAPLGLLVVQSRQG